MFGLPSTLKPTVDDTPSIDEDQQLEAAPNAPAPVESIPPAAEEPTAETPAAPSVSEGPDRDPGPGRPPRASTRRRRPASGLSAVPEAPESRRAKVVKMNMDGIDYKLPDVEEAHVRDTSVHVSQSLPQTIELARARWGSENFAALNKTPGISQFREALLRVGLKHMDDPEFVDLMPRDKRTGPRSPR